MSSRLSCFALLAPLAVAVLTACPEVPPPVDQPSLKAQFPNGSRVAADGVSRLRVVVTAKNADGKPQTDPITVTMPQDGGFLAAAAGGPLVEGLTFTATPDSEGRLEFEYQCAGTATSSVTLKAENADAKVNVNVGCTEPVGALDIAVDATACDGLQADGQTTCEIKLTVTLDANGVIIPKSGAVRLSVVTGNNLNLLAPLGENVGAAELTVQTDAQGKVSFSVVAPAAPGTVTIDIEFAGFKVSRDVPVDLFDNQAAITFSPPSLNVTGGASQVVEVTVLAANGQPAANRTLTSISIAGEQDDATIAIGAGEAGAELLDVILDGEGKVSLTVNTPVVAALTEFVVTAVFAALPNLDPLAVALTIKASEEGALLLNLTADPAFLKSDGITAEQTTDVTVQFSQNSVRVVGGTLTLTIPGDSVPLIRFANDLLVNELALDDTDFDDVGEVIVPIKVVADVTPGFARVLALGEDSDGNTIEEELRIEVRRDPVLQTVLFVSVTPNAPLGVQGGSQPSSAEVVFRLLDDQGDAMPNVPVLFRRNTTAPVDVLVLASDISDAAGNVSTVLSAGTQPGPVTVIAEALGRFGQSTPIAIVGGLASFETSFLQCAQKAVTDPYVLNCGVQLVDRFSNNVSGSFVQFFAEGSHEEAAATAGGGLASVSISSGGLELAPADMLGWSYAIVVPADRAELVQAGFPFGDADDCTDGTTSSTCDVVALCNAADASIYCPLPPGCLQRAQSALAVLADEPTSYEYATLSAERQRVADYIATYNACGFPIGCFTGDLGGLRIEVADGDECPVAAGCFDFTRETECPHDSLITVMAMTRGAEGFSDIDGDGVLDLSFEDINGNGAQDVGETGADDFVDLPEPFLDRNDNCFRDDLTGNARFDTRPILKIENTDQFSDVSGNHVFGFGAAGGPITETNGVWDADTAIFFSEKVLLVREGFVVTGEVCAIAGVLHTCANGSTADCRETAGGNIAGCIGTLPLTAASPTTEFAYRFSDSRGNCPSPGFALGVTATADSDIVKLSGAVNVLLDADACGFDAELANPTRPYCDTSRPLLGAPVLEVTVTRQCPEPDPGSNGSETKLVLVELSLGGEPHGTVSFNVTCPLPPQ